LNARRFYLHRPLTTVLAGVACWLTFASRAGLADPPPISPEVRAARFLDREVARWSRENKCFSCHHNGDAATALLRAEKLGILPANGTLDSTINWLVRPAGWDHNGGDGPFNDKVLARIVFGSTLKDTIDTRRGVNRSALVAAAQGIVADQDKDGSWKLQGEDGLGSPASHGRALATMTARDTLRAADLERFRPAIAKADAWLMAREPKGVFDSAVTLWASVDSLADAEQVARVRLRALDLIRRGRSDDGGWGPYVTSPPEIFDTAIVLLAIQALKPPGDEIESMIRKGRAYLIANQSVDGSWVETTRPSGSESEAQHLSTTAWALLALLETRPGS